MCEVGQHGLVLKKSHPYVVRVGCRLTPYAVVMLLQVPQAHRGHRVLLVSKVCKAFRA